MTDPDPRDFPHPCTGCGAKRPFGPEGHTVDCPVADPMRNEPGFAARVYDSVARRQATPPTPDPRSAGLTAASEALLERLRAVAVASRPWPAQRRGVDAAIAILDEYLPRIEAEAARPAPTALVEALRHCATVIVSAGPALQRAVTASPNQTTLRLNRALQQHAEDAYREAKAALAAQPPAPPG